MPRPIKCRRVCHLPDNREFKPTRHKMEHEPIILNVDEYETIRLIDKDGLSQQQCSQQMNIARTTVQMIYTSARKKIANALVDGVPIRIEGGNYHLCDKKDDRCPRKNCHCRFED